MRSEEEKLRAFLIWCAGIENDTSASRGRRTTETIKKFDACACACASVGKGTQQSILALCEFRIHWCGPPCAREHITEIICRSQCFFHYEIVPICTLSINLYKKHIYSVSPQCGWNRDRVCFNSPILLSPFQFLIVFHVVFVCVCHSVVYFVWWKWTLFNLKIVQTASVKLDNSNQR